MQARQRVLDWAHEGRIAPADLRRALEAAGALPDAAAWRSFLDRMFLFAGTILTAAGVIFFLAFNWNELGRMAKFALVEALLAVTLVFVWRLGVERPSGRAALLGAALFTGALLALIGQTYQTGADTFELFGVWAVAILPWTLVARFPPLWLAWLLIVNLAAYLYLGTFRGPLWFFSGTERQLWLLFTLNTVALVVWEGLALSGFEWLRERWSARIVAIASGGFATSLAMMDVLERPERTGAGIAAWLAWMAAAYLLYRHSLKDLFVLAGGVLSVVVVVTTWIGRHFLRADAGAFLLVGLVVIGLSAAGGWWLKSIAAEEER
jgi:uncharacterized membrane protein